MGILDGDSPVSGALSLFIVQLLLITVFSRGLGKILKYVKQPLVVAGGILLGPSALGLIPGFQKTLFPSDSMVILEVMANFGLILFMFLVGLEVEYEVLTSTLRKFAVISTIGVLVPVVLSIPVSFIIFSPEYAGEDKIGNFILFTGIAMGASALPVLARMLAERGMLKHRLGSVTMSATAIDDLEGWVLLAIVVSIARAKSSLNILWTILMAVGNILVLIFVVRPIFARIAKKINDRGYVSPAMFFIVLVILLTFAWLTDTIGISAIFGAFEVGCVVPRNGKLVNELFTRLKDIINVLFLPLYFTFSGLRTEFGLLNTADAWGVFALIFIVQFLSKLLGSGLAGKYIGGLNTREALCFGILMQTKGLVALITLNLGLDYNIITPKFFAANVMMVLLSTIVTAPLVEFIYPAKKMREATLLAKGKKNNIFSILLCCSSAKNARSLVSVSEHLIAANKLADDFSAHVTALNIVEDNPETSGYLLNWFNETKSKWNAVLRSARDRAKAIGIKIDPQVVFSSGEIDVGAEICNISRQKGVHLVLLGYKQLFDNSQYILSDNIIIQHVIENVDADVGILIDKDSFRKRASHILCPLIGSPFDSIALKYAEKIARAEGVQVLLLNIINPSLATNIENVNHLTGICTAYSSMKYLAVSSTDPFKAVLSEIISRIGDYALVVVGDSDYGANFYTECPVSLLVVRGDDNPNVDDVSLIPSSSESEFGFTEMEIV